MKNRNKEPTGAEVLGIILLCFYRIRISEAVSCQIEFVTISLFAVSGKSPARKNIPENAAHRFPFGGTGIYAYELWRRFVRDSARIRSICWMNAYWTEKIGCLLWTEWNFLDSCSTKIRTNCKHRNGHCGPIRVDSWILLFAFDRKQLENCSLPLSMQWTPFTDFLKEYHFSIFKPLIDVVGDKQPEICADKSLILRDEIL